MVATSRLADLVTRPAGERPTEHHLFILMLVSDGHAVSSPSCTDAILSALFIGAFIVGQSGVFPPGHDNDARHTNRLLDIHLQEFILRILARRENSSFEPIHASTWGPSSIRPSLVLGPTGESETSGSTSTVCPKSGEKEHAKYGGRSSLGKHWIVKNSAVTRASKA